MTDITRLIDELRVFVKATTDEHRLDIFGRVMAGYCISCGREDKPGENVCECQRVCFEESVKEWRSYLVWGSEEAFTPDQPKR